MSFRFTQEAFIEEKDCRTMSQIVPGPAAGLHPKTHPCPIAGIQSLPVHHQNIRNRPEHLEQHDRPTEFQNVPQLDVTPCLTFQRIDRGFTHEIETDRSPVYRPDCQTNDQRPPQRFPLARRVSPPEMSCTIGINVRATECIHDRNWRRPRTRHQGNQNSIGCLKTPINLLGHPTPVPRFV